MDGKTDCKLGRKGAFLHIGLLHLTLLLFLGFPQFLSAQQSLPQTAGEGQVVSQEVGSESRSASEKILSDTEGRAKGLPHESAPVGSSAVTSKSQKPAETESGEVPRSDGLAVGMFQRGQASYYAEQFHGLRTSNGERFNMYAMTAAHKSLPFSTMLTVENLENGKSVEVRVNDRGPYIEGRILDLSKRAAELLGMARKGVVASKITITALPEDRKNTAKHVAKPLGNIPRSIAGEIPTQKRFAIQLASYSETKHAEPQLQRLERAGIPIQMEKHGKYHRLIVVSLNQEQVAYYRKELVGLGFPRVLIRQE